MAAPLWSPSKSRVEATRLTSFLRAVEQRWGVEASGYDALYRFSIDRPADFWQSVWEFCGIRGHMGTRVVVDLDKMPGARFFPDARLNFAENLLRLRDDTPALIFNGEGQRHRTVSHAQVFSEVCRFATALRHAGVQPGDP